MRLPKQVSGGPLRADGLGILPRTWLSEAQMGDVTRDSNNALDCALVSVSRILLWYRFPCFNAFVDMQRSISRLVRDVQLSGALQRGTKQSFMLTVSH